MMEDRVMPMACSFVHQTPCLSRIQRFQRDIEACSVFLKKEHSSRCFYLIVADHLCSDCQFDMCDDVDKDAFEKSGWEHNVGHLFLLLLETHTEKLSGMIDELEILFKSRHAAATVEDMIRKQVWEVLGRDAVGFGHFNQGVVGVGRRTNGILEFQQLLALIHAEGKRSIFGIVVWCPLDFGRCDNCGK